ncbi:MAG: knotted carbamoyltransferase YgeW [Candidatus Eisenbacteria bacterium]
MNPTAPAMPAFDHGVLASLFGRSLYTTNEWSTSELETLLNVAAIFQAADFRKRSLAMMPDELAYGLFFDQSTRTRSAWAGAAARLGMRPVISDGSSTQVAHGETPSETGAMLGMNAHALGVRHDKVLGEGNHFIREMKRGIDEYLKATGDSRQVPMVNLQCDVDHPTQALADLQYLRDVFPGGLKGKRIAVSWAYSPSYAKPLSVAQGVCTLFTRFGADVVLAHPEPYRLMDASLEAARSHAQQSGGSFEVVHTMDEAFRGADVVYPKSWGPYDLMLERVEANKAKDNKRMADIEQRALAQNARYRDWICDERRMGLTRNGKALYMHPLPADIGDEVSTGVMERAKMDVARQANKKMYVIMAMLAVAKMPDLARRLEDLRA